jgi:DNA topoisomerase-3
MSSIHTLVSDPAMKQKLKEKKGIGQEATRTQIIETLVKRGLITRKGKQLISSPAGRALIKALPKRVVDPILTAMWEDALDKIAQNKLSLDDFLAKQTMWVKQLIDEAKQTDIDVSGLLESNPPSKGGSKSGGAPKAPAQPTGEKCPKCGVGDLVKRGPTKSGKYFLGCNNWPKCDFVKW